MVSESENSAVCVNSIEYNSATRGRKRKEWKLERAVSGCTRS